MESLLKMDLVSDNSMEGEWERRRVWDGVSELNWNYKSVPSTKYGLKRVVQIELHRLKNGLETVERAKHFRFVMKQLFYVAQ